MTLIKDKKGAVPPIGNRRKRVSSEMWCDRVWYSLKHLDDLIALNYSPLTRLTYIERIAEEKYKNEALARARALRNTTNLCIDRLLKELENEASSAKEVQYLKLIRRGLNNSQIAKELGLTREHVSKVYRNKTIQLVTQEFLSTVGHPNLALTIKTHPTSHHLQFLP